MFTGIVEETGWVETVKPGAASIQLTIRARAVGRSLKIGDSLAVNGCCLTVAKKLKRGADTLVSFDLLRETWDRTNLHHARPGYAVNLERSLRAGGRLGGHFVTGHIDGVGSVLRWEKSGADHSLEIAAPAEILRYMIRKGSIALDGISLTVDFVKKKHFRVWIIPQTLKVTALRERKEGDAVNLEADMLGKFVERFVTARLEK
jgi:riboflavin synthase